MAQIGARRQIDLGDLIGEAADCIAVMTLDQNRLGVLAQADDQARMAGRDGVTGGESHFDRAFESNAARDDQDKPVIQPRRIQRHHRTLGRRGAGGQQRLDQIGPVSQKIGQASQDDTFGQRADRRMDKTAVDEHETVRSARDQRRQSLAFRRLRQGGRGRGLQPE